MESKLYESYLINLKKDVGRKLYCSYIIDLFNATLWEGTDATTVSIKHNKEVIKWSTTESGTEGAKYTKIRLLEHFLKTSKKKYILLMEDDISIHSDMVKPENVKTFKTELERFLKGNNVTLLYLGVSRHIKPKKTHITDYSIESFTDYFDGSPKRCSGAYGVIINRNVIKVILARAKNHTLYGKPFDLTCLGFVSVNNPSSTYILHPPLFVPNITSSNIRDSSPQELFWRKLKVNKELYRINKLGTLCVWICDDFILEELRDTYRCLKCVKPIIDVVFFMPVVHDGLDFIDKLKRCNSDDYRSYKINNYIVHRDIIIRLDTKYSFNYQCGVNILLMFKNIN